MKVGDLVRIHLLDDLTWRDGLGVFMGYYGTSKSHSYVFVEGKKLRFLTMDVKAVK
jgi:hypothetical protein